MTKFKPPKYRPLESFGTELINMMLRAVMTPVTAYAEESGAPPRMLAPGELIVDPDRTIVNRWRRFEFTSHAAAKRFKSLQHLAHELHELRRSMKHFNHPHAADVYRVRISVDDYTGSLKIRSHDMALAELLGPSYSTGASPPTLVPEILSDPDSTDFDDPLNPKSQE